MQRCDALACQEISGAAWSSIIDLTVLLETSVLYLLYCVVRCARVDAGALGSLSTCL